MKKLSPLILLTALAFVFATTAGINLIHQFGQKMHAKGEHDAMVSVLEKLQLKTESPIVSPIKAAVFQEVVIVGPEPQSVTAHDYAESFAKQNLTGDQLLVLKNVGKNYTFGPKEPAELPDISDRGFTWSDWLRSHLIAVIAEPVAYRNHWTATDRKQIALAYGIFNLGNLRDQFIEKAKGVDVWKSFGSLVKSEKVQETLLDWSVANFKEVYESLPREDRQTYDEILQHAINYLENFDLEKEAAYWTKLEKLEVFSDDQIHYTVRDFTYRDANGFFSPYRKLECMFYRRIAGGDFTRDRLLFLAKRVEKAMADWPR